MWRKWPSGSGGNTASPCTAFTCPLPAAAHVRTCAYTHPPAVEGQPGAVVGGAANQRRQVEVVWRLHERHYEVFDRVIAGVPRNLPNEAVRLPLQVGHIHGIFVLPIPASGPVGGSADEGQCRQRWDPASAVER